MVKNTLKFLVIFINLSISSVVSQRSESLKVPEDEDDGKSSLVFVFDTTGSMANDLRQLREGAEMILDTALEESGIIGDFVFVPFHDPAVGPATVTKDKQVFKAALSKVQVYGGGDCPEMSLSGIKLGLSVSRPRSYMYVFTDATAADHRAIRAVLDAIQRKQTQVVFVLTGHCNDLNRPNYLVYPQIAAASSGQVFNLNKTSVHKVLDFVRSTLKGRTVNLGSAVNPPGYNYSQGIPVDSNLGEVTVSVSGAQPSIKVVSPRGEQLTGPPQLQTVLDLAQIMVVKVLQPEPGNWTITTGSTEDHSVKVVGLSNLTFNHGFSVERPGSITETSYRPLQGAYNYMMISLTGSDRPVQINYAEILSLNGKTLFEVPLKEIDSQKKIYLADAFMPPDDLFYVAINGRDEFNQELRRVGATAVQAKPPDVPYLTVPKKVSGRAHESVTLQCAVESLVPVTSHWTRDFTGLQKEIASLQSTSIDYVIPDLSEEYVGTYYCVAKNVAGVSRAATEVTLIVDPPQVTVSPGNHTLELGANFSITCAVLSDALLFKYQLVFNGTLNNYVTDIHMEPNVDGLYVFSKYIHNASERDAGIYSCLAVNRGGKSTHSTYITVQSKPAAQILGPHTITKLAHSDTQLVCQVEYATKIVWSSNDGVVRSVDVNMSSTDMLDVRDVSEDGVWTCTAVRGDFNASDSVNITVLMKPQVSIEGSKNVSIVNGTNVDIICNIKAKPVPRIIWHRETEDFLNHTVSSCGVNEYKSVLTLDSGKEQVNGTYFCFGENSEGIHQDSVTVTVTRKMALIEGFHDQTVQLYSRLSLPCHIDCHPSPKITWYHNNSEITNNDNMYLSENNNTLFIMRVGFEELGSYVCEADNGVEKMRVGGRLDVVGLEPPLLSKEPVRRVTKKGQSTILTCRVIKGNPQPVLSWQHRSNTSSPFTELPKGVVANRDRSELIIYQVQTDHWGVYRCLAENVLGTDVYDMLLVVQYPPVLKSSPVASDKPLLIESGKKVVLSCEASGNPPPVVIWSKNHRPVRYSKNIYVTNASELIIEKSTKDDSGLFTCNVTSALGSSQRNFTVTVYTRPSITLPGVDPELSVLEGELVELPCIAHGSPAPLVTWLHDGVNINDTRKHVDEFGLRFVANLTDFGEYTCVASNQYGNDSFSFFVYIWVAPYMEPPLHSTIDVLQGTNASLVCDVVGFPIPTVFWEFQEHLLEDNTTDLSFNNIGNLYITNAATRHGGLYSCIAENIAGFAEKSFHVNINEPPKILADNFTGPYIATNMDSRLVISCRASGQPKPFVVWHKDDTYIFKDSRYDVDRDGTLTIRDPSEELSGQYTCVAMNRFGTTNKTVTVEIYSLPAAKLQAEEPQSSLTNITVLEGSNATIECPVRASHKDKVKWYKDAKLISTDTLKIPNVTRDNSSIYACVVTNAVTSTHANIRVNVEWPPLFKREGIKRAGGNVEVVRGDDCYFDCEVDAKPEAKTQWLFNSRPLLGEVSPRLKLMNVQLRHIGQYKCIVSNTHGTIDRRFTLDVLVPPFISEFDVLDVQLKEGMNATLECNAKGSPSPNIEWTFNNTNWHLENTSLTTYNATLQTEGLFRCDATNNAGAAHLVYRVSVATGATVRDVIQYTGGGGTTLRDMRVEGRLNSRMRLACTASGNPAPRIQWIRNGATISQNAEDIGYADLILEDIQTRDAGEYTCVASNEAGTDERRVTVEVLEPPKIFRDPFQSGDNDSTTRLQVMSGQAFYLHCHPYGNPMPEVYWFKDDLPLRLFDSTMVSTDYGEVLVSSGATQQQAGVYTCVATSRVGNDTRDYLVDVLVPPPTPKDSLKRVNAKLGTQLNLTCPAEGIPPPQVMWIKHPYKEIGSDMPGVQLTQDNYTLILNKTEVSDSGKYTCIISNKVGNTEVVFEVIVEKAPSIAGNTGSNVIESHVVLLRRSLVLKCEADGNPPPKISWLKDTQQLGDNLSNIQRVLGNSLLTIWSANTRDAGQYICIAENTAGTAHRRYNVAVQVPGKWSTWSQWSLCNATCGLGYQQRARVCHYLDDYNVTYVKSTKSDKIILDESGCKGPANDRRKCHMPPCEEEDSQPHWSMWSKWSSCSVTCGVGTQARSRRCKSKVACTGDNVQIRKCPDLPQCDDTSQENNDVFTSQEASSYIPEATFETQPETVNTPYDDVEEVHLKAEQKYSIVYYDVNVTENLDKSDRGPCAPGYRYNKNNTTHSCEDIDECLIESNMCHSSQICVNTAGAYRCTCPAGFTALGVGQRCLDINECVQEIDGCEYACVNTAGGYVCACPRHMRLLADKRRCGATRPSYRRHSHEDMKSGEYLSTSIDFPARYMKNKQQ